MEANRWRVRVAKATFLVEQHVRISGDKMMFAKAAEQNLNTDNFKTAKLFEKWPRAVYELKYLNGTPIEGTFYREELTPIRITDWTPYEVDEILDKRFRRSIHVYLVRCRGNSQEFHSWMAAASVKNI